MGAPGPGWGLSSVSSRLGFKLELWQSWFGIRLIVPDSQASPTVNSLAARARETFGRASSDSLESSQVLLLQTSKMSLVDVDYVGSSVPGIDGDFVDYRWIVVTGALAAFFMAWGIGANDVANSFATSVGSKTLTLWQAVIIAGIFEFAGAVGLGAETAKTVASDISNTAYYKDAPEMYMYGMLCSLTTAGLWLFIATFMKLPVSTTHSIIGSIMGFSLVYGSWDGVLWNVEKGNFPYSKGFLPVVLSWFFSPLIGGILSAIFFSASKYIILRRENSSKWAIWSLPFLLFLTFFINLMFVLAKGASSRMKASWPCSKKEGMFGLMYDDCSEMYSAAAWIAAAAATGVAVFGGAIGIPMLFKKLASSIADEKEAEESAVANKDKEEVAVEMEDCKKLDKIPLPPLAWTKPDIWYMSVLWYFAFPFQFVWRQVTFGLFYDIHDSRIQTVVSKEMENSAEQFNPHTEKVYEYLQVISAACVAFAHGSNDVANAVGPFAAIFYVYENWKIPGSKTDAPIWIFVFGGVGIVIGLIMYGYNIIKELGCNLLHLTPSRGFSAELAAGMTISLSSFFGIPVSTTQIITGAELGVGLCEGRLSAVNWKLFAKIFSGWILTIVLNLAFCACLFSMGGYAPSIIQTQQLRDMRQAIMETQMVVIKNKNISNTVWKDDPEWWVGEVASPLMYNGSKLAPKLNSTYYAMKSLINPSKYVTIDQILYYNSYAQQIVANYSADGIGQNDIPAVECNGSELATKLNRTFNGAMALINPSKYVTIDQISYYNSCTQHIFANYGSDGLG
eukprot:gene4400-14525_t